MNNLVYFIKTIRKKIWWIIVPTVLSIIISFVLTMPSIKPPLHEITLQFFPTRLPSAFRIAENLYVYNFLTSKEVKALVLKKYGKKDNPNSRLTSSNYDSRISVKEDQNIAFIAVKNEDKEMAREIAQYLIDLYSERSKQLKQHYHQEHADFYAGMIQIARSNIDSIKQELSHLAKDSSLYVQTLQTQELTRAILGTYGNASRIDQKEIERTKQILSNNGGEILSLEMILETYTKILGSYQQEYDLSINELSKMNLYANVFSTTYSEQSNSNRTIIILMATLLTFVVSITLIILIDTYKPLFKEIKEKISQQ